MSKFERWLIIRKNLFSIDSACDEILSAFAEQKMKPFLRLFSQRVLQYNSRKVRKKYYKQLELRKTVKEPI
jgi:hypothetical protein